MQDSSIRKADLARKGELLVSKQRQAAFLPARLPVKPEIA
jgi:hypothetical protein